MDWQYHILVEKYSNQYNHFIKCSSGQLKLDICIFFDPEIPFLEYTHEIDAYGSFTYNSAKQEIIQMFINSSW